MNSFNVEDNSDLDTSNESYISSSEEELSDGEEDKEDAKIPGQKKNIVLTRETKAIIGRRFNKHFDRIGVLAENYWR